MTPRRTVLVADDSRHVVEALAAAFEGAGWRVLTAVNGEEVLRLLAAGPADALLVDLYMPRLNGADVCRLVKGHPAWQRTLLVLMSSRLGPGDEGLCRRLGADHLLHKPLDPAAVLALVSGAVPPPGGDLPARTAS
jgi:CheY-like chemotaxis protein